MTETVEQTLAGVRDKRGYLLAHHALLTLQGIDAISAYDQFYSTLSLDSRHLSDNEKEFVWLGPLIAKRAPIT